MLFFTGPQQTSHSIHGTDSRSWSTKLARMKDVDLIQFLSDWLTYAADNAKAGKPPRVWKMFGFYFIKRFWNAKVTNLRMFHPPSTQNVKVVVYLRKRSHKRFSPRVWSEVNNACRRSLTQRSPSWSSPVAPKVWVETEITVANCQKMGHVEGIQTEVVHVQRHHCLSLSVA